jgi:D-amino-acid dehydrogenase
VKNTPPGSASWATSTAFPARRDDEQKEPDNVNENVHGSSDGVRSNTADAVVIGGGIVGVCTALYLQQTGRKVTIVERGTPGAAASGHNGGVFNVGECVPTGTPGVIRALPRMLVDPLSPLVIRYRYLPRLAPWMTRFLLASTPKRVEKISAALQNLTDRAMDCYDPLLEDSAAASLMHEGGLVIAYQSDEAFNGDRFARDLRTRRGAKFDVLEEAGVEVLDPALAGRFRHVVHRPLPRFTLDPERFTRALADDFVLRGGTVHEAIADGFERRNGRVQAVSTSSGAIRADTVVLAAGAWSRRLSRQLGLDVPLDTERGYGVHLANPGISLRLPTIVSDFHIALRPTPTGVQVAGVDELASVDAPPRYELLDRVLRGARKVFPELRTDHSTRWMHLRPSMPDSLPVIGQVPGYGNAYVAFGHGHKGLCLGGITGKLVQQLIDDEPTTVDLEPYQPTRFSLRRYWPPSRRKSGHSTMVNR